MWKRELKRSVAILLSLIMIFNVFADTGITVNAAIQTSNGGFKVSKFKVTVDDGTPVTDDSDLYSGQPVKVSFEWELDDSVRVPAEEFDRDHFTPQEFTIDTNSEDFKCAGLNIPGLQVGSASAPQPLHATGTLAPVGSFYMEDGVIHIIIDDPDFYQGTNGRMGGVSFDGTIESSNDNNDDGTKKPVEFGDYTSLPDYYLSQNPSSASVYKQRSGGLVTKDEGGVRKYEQTFTVDINIKDGKVTNLDLTDTTSPAGGFGVAKDIQVTTSTASGIPAGSYASLDELLAAIKNATLNKDETISFQYTMEVSADIYKQDADYYNNVIEGTYINNRSEAPKPVKSEAGIWVSKPSINKQGAGYEVRNGVGYVKWTITVNVGEAYSADKPNLTDYVSSISDIPGVGLNLPTSVSLDPADFVATGNPGTFTYTYETPVTDEVKNSITGSKVKNKVEMTTKDGNIYKSPEVDYNVPGQDASVNKKVASYERIGDKVFVTWEVTISNLPEGVKDVTVNDDARAWIENQGTQNLLYEVFVDGVQVIDGTGIIRTDIIKSVGAFVGYGGSYENWGTFVFQDSYTDAKAAAKEPIKLQYRTMISENTSGKGYRNSAEVSYTDKTTGNSVTLPKATADFHDKTTLLTKSGEAVSGKNSIAYKIKVDIPNLEIEAPGKYFTITDVLPAGMTLDDSSVEVVVVDMYTNVKTTLQKNTDYSISKGNVSISPSEQTEKLTLQIAAKDSWLKYIQGYSGNTTDQNGYYLEVRYTADVKDQAAFITQGVTKTFVNSASGTYDGNSVGSDTSSVDLEPGKVIMKTAEYTQSTAPYAKYTVTVNPDGIKLLTTGDTLTARDEMGMALRLVDAENFKTTAEKDKYCVKVKDVATGNYLTKGTDYSYTIDGSRRGITFTLPDGKSLELEYWVYIEPETKLTAANSFNRFKLTGFESGGLEDGVSFDIVSYKPDGWAGSKVGPIIIYKFWEDEESNQIALEGSVFRLVKVKYDEATQKMVEDNSGTGSLFMDNIRITDDNRYDGNKIIIDNIPANQIMALYEIDADTGFAINKKPYYFVLKGSTEISLPPGIVIKEFNEQNNLIEYENKKAAKLTLEKTIVGDVTQAQAAGITFTIKDSAGEVVETFTLADCTYASGKWSKTFDRMMPDTYTVEETQYDLTGKPVKSVVYKLSTDSDWSSSAEDAKNTVASVTLEAEKTTILQFKNTYDEPQEAKIRVAKSFSVVGGNLTWDDIKNSLSFVIKDASGNPVATIAGTDLTYSGGLYISNWVTVAPGTYTVTETRGDIAGYSAVTTYKIGTGSAVDGLVTGNISLVKDDTETVTFTNTYTQDTAKIKVTKALSEASNTLTWDDIKGTISFVIKDASGATVKTIAGTELTANGSVYESDWVTVTPGTYTVTETRNDISGYSVTTTYQIGAGSAVDGLVTGNISLVKDDTETVAYTNTYTKDMAKIKVTKAFSEATNTLTWDDIKVTISFVIKDASGATVKTIAGTELTANGSVYESDWVTVTPGTYTVTEVRTNIDGYSVTTTYQVDGGTSVTNVTTLGIPVAKDDQKTVAYTNTYVRDTAKIKVTKTFSEATNTLTWDDIKGTISFTIKDASGATVKTIAGTDLTLNGSVYESDLVTVPAPGSYTVEETRTDIAGYTVVTKYKVNNGGEVTGLKTSELATTKDSQTTVAFTNTYTQNTSVAQLKVTKTFSEVSNTLTWDDIKDTISFTIKDGTGTEITTIRGSELILQSGVYESGWVIVPAPGSYTVTETRNDIPGYSVTTTYKVDAGTSTEGTTASLTGMVNGDQSTVAFTNTYTRDTAKIKVTKTFTEAGNTLTWDDIKGTISFVIKDASGATVKTIAGTDLTLNGSVYESDWVTVTPGTYTVTEVRTNIDGYSVTTTYQVDGGTSVTNVTTLGIPVAKDDQKTVAYTNTYVRDTAKIKVTKTFSEATNTLTWDDIKGTISFTIKDASGATVKTIAGTDLTLNGSVYESDWVTVTPGTYTVTETRSDISGYSVTTTYKVDAGTSTEGTTASLTGMVNGDQSTIAFTNTYTRNSVNITLSINKVIKGTTTDLDGAILEIYKSEDMDANGEPITGKTPLLTWTSVAGQTKDISGVLEIGKSYVMYEKLAPIGYQKSANVGFEVKADGTIALTGNNGLLVNDVLTMEDEPMPNPVGNLILVKNISGTATKDQLDKKISFRVQNADTATPAFDQTYVIGEGTFLWNSISQNYIQTINDLPAGKYKVTEILGTSTPSGMTCKTTWVVNATTATNGKSLKTGNFEITDGSTVTVTFTNTYSNKTSAPSTPTTLSNPVPSPEPDVPGVPLTPDTPEDIVKTGDSAPIGRWIGLLFGGMTGFIAGGIVLRRRKKNEKDSK